MSDIIAGVAELADAQASEACGPYTSLEVRILPSALRTRGGIGIHGSLRSYAERREGSSPSECT